MSEPSPESSSDPQVPLESSASAPTMAGDEELLAALADDFGMRLRRREHPTIEEYVAKHPALGERIRKVLGAVAIIEQGRSSELPGEGPGSTIGRYKLLERIGEGGFGIVYMAEQHHPVRRKVALKVIKPGMDSRQILARFEAERQALAIMDHPNIARVLDAGATDSGRPYFVMELVKGEPITEYCDRNHLDPRQRLELFVQVCHAVQHAHQKGIIHRDIKPSNVLVMMHDTTPVVKVIDFGVAKALGQELTEKTLFTGFAQLVGTPLYMSPEQAGHSSLDVDTRSDIYSLGVLLYELLTGTTPFDKERFEKAAQDEIRRIIREEEPPKPSTRLSESKERLPSISAQRQTEPGKLTKLMRGELDWIVMKALEKDRGRRYETANGLARDVERYLCDEAVQACPPSNAYRVRKFVRRNKGPVTAAVLVLLTLVGGIIGTSFGLIRAEQARRAEVVRAEGERRARQDAEAQRQRAEDNFYRARVAVRDLLTLPALGSGEWAQLPPSLRKKFEEEAAKYYSSFEGNSPDPSLRYEAAVGQRSLGYLYHKTDPKRAEELIRQSIAALEQLHSDFPARGEYRAQLAWSHVMLFTVLQGSDRTVEAERAAERAAELHTASSAERTELAAWYFNLASQFIGADRMRDAAEMYRRGLKADPGNRWHWYYAAAVYLHAGDMERYRGACQALLDRAEALTAEDPHQGNAAAKTCALAPDAAPDFPRVERLARLILARSKNHPDERYFILTKGMVEYRGGRYKEAIASLKRFAPNSSGVHFDATGFCVMAMAHLRLGNGEQARAALASARDIIAEKPRDAMSHVDWLHGVILFREAEKLIRDVSQEELAAARQREFDRELAGLSRAIEQDPADAKRYHARGIFLFQSGRGREAFADLGKAIELDASSHTRLHEAAGVYLYVGDVERYRGACRALVDCAESYPADEPQAAEIAAKTCALAPASVADFTRVERLAQRAVTGNENHRYYRFFALAKGLTEFRAGRDERAIEWLERFRPRAGGGTHWDATSFAALAMAHHRLGHTAAAREALDSAREISAKKPKDWMSTTGPWLDWVHCEILLRESEALLAK